MPEPSPIKEPDADIGIAGKKTHSISKIPRSTRPKVAAFWNTPQEIP